jgi:hypothetical protein
LKLPPLWVLDVEKFCYTNKATGAPNNSSEVCQMVVSPGFPVKTRGFDNLHAALSTESRTRSRRQQREPGNPGTPRP